MSVGPPQCFTVLRFFLKLPGDTTGGLRYWLEVRSLLNGVAGVPELILKILQPNLDNFFLFPVTDRKENFSFRIKLDCFDF